MPTVIQRTNIEIARDEFARLRADVSNLLEESLAALEAEMKAAGAPSWR